MRAERAASSPASRTSRRTTSETSAPTWRHDERRPDPIRRRRTSMKVHLALLVVVALLVAVAAATAETNSRPDGNDHRYVGQFVATSTLHVPASKQVVPVCWSRRPCS